MAMCTTSTSPAVRAASVRDMKCAEYCFKHKTDFSKSPNKDADNFTKIQRTICGLCNKCGGVIEVRNKNQQKVTSTSLDNWKRDLSDQQKLMTSDQYRKYIRFQDLPDEEGLLIIVKWCPTCLTVCSNLFIRHDEQSYMVESSAEMLDLLDVRSSRCALPDIPQLPMTIGDVTTLKEGPALEFKHWQNPKDYQKSFQHERNTKGVYSLFSSPAGGSVVVGVHEYKSKNQFVVEGQDVGDDNDQQLLKQYLETEYFAKAIVVCIKPVSSRPLELGTDYDIQFLPLDENMGLPTSTPSPKKMSKRVLIVLRMARCEGAVFKQPPESYSLDEAGEIKLLTLSEWADRLSKSRSATPSKNDEQLGMRTLAHSKPISAANLPQTNATELDSLTDSDDTEDTVGKPRPGEITATPEVSTDDMINDHRLSWIEHQPDWQNNLTPVSRHIIDNTNRLSDSATLKPERPIKFTPERNILMGICNPAVTAIDHSLPPETAAVAIAAKTWRFYVPHQVSRQDVPGHVMDVVVMTEKAELHFWVITDHNTDTEKQEDYMYETGRLLKLQFVESMRLLGLPESEIIVQCNLLQAGKLASKGTIQSLLLKQYFSRNRLSDMQLAISYFFLASEDNKCYIKNSLGDDLLAHLTWEQMNLLLTSGGLCQLNFIEGPPGSGKTIAALAVMKQYPIGRLLWLAATSSFAAFLKHRGVRHVRIASTDRELNTLIVSKEFQNKSCIIIDDFHNTDFSLGCWKKLRDHVKKKKVPTATLR